MSLRVVAARIRQLADLACPAPAMSASMATSFSTSSTALAACAMPTRPTTATTPSSRKRVRALAHQRRIAWLDARHSVPLPARNQRVQTDHRGQRYCQVRVSNVPRPAHVDLACSEDDTNWPKKNVVGRQVLEIRLGNNHISFEVNMHARYAHRIHSQLVHADGEDRLAFRNQ